MLVMFMICAKQKRREKYTIKTIFLKKKFVIVVMILDINKKSGYNNIDLL